MTPKKKVKKVRLCQLPTSGSITRRTSTITNAFFNAIIPIDPPTEADELEALKILVIEPNDICCVYCGGKSTEWDHLRPIIKNRKPTGFITEIQNLVPACGKCNQSKGNSDWREWMQGNARHSPKSQDIADITERMERLAAYESWRKPTEIPFEKIVDSELWEKHQTNLAAVLDPLRRSQSPAEEIKHAVSDHRISSLHSQSHGVAAAKA